MRPVDRPRKTKLEDLKVGMFVKLPGSWTSHNFVRSKFLIKDDTQIAKIAKSGIEVVIVDPLKSVIRPEVHKRPNYVPQKPAPKPKPKPWAPPLMPEDFSAFTKDPTVAPKRKASYTYEVALHVMDKLLKDPSVENITQFKEGVTDVVDLILEDEETSDHLLKITSHDQHTFTHSVNVGVMSVMLAKSLYGESSHHDMHELGAGFFLHDLGKVNLSEDLINKPGEFDEDERDQMQKHPLGGYQLLSDTDQLSPECKLIVMQHHERDDGSGYPQGLVGDEIHIYSRICAITDVFDGLTSRRPHKHSLQLYDALLLMKNEMSNKFNNEVFSEFVQLFRN